VAFITGAGNGINRGIALVLAAEGYSIAVSDINDEGAAETIEMIEKNGGTGIACHVDVADRATVDAGVAAGIAAFGRVDALVSGAGYPQDKPFLEMTEQDWDRMIAVHMKGAFNTTQATVPHMRDRGFGRIVCISSMAANNGSWNHAHYAAAKASSASSERFPRMSGNGVSP
jgi:NAD(P)-dependent dehydrogenase (short-subunit alcohol dehydrogenase family)